MRLYLSSCAPATALKKKKKGYKLKVGLRVRVRVITPMFAIAPLKLRVPWESAIIITSRTIIYTSNKMSRQLIQ